MADNPFYDPVEEQWPDLKRGRVLLIPARVGVDRKTGKMIVGWTHVVQSIQVIFATRFHERVLRRWVGSFVPHLLGETAVVRAIARFYWAVATSLDLWEPNYRVQRVRVGTRADGTDLTSAEDIRQGNLATQTEGVYRPRAHLGDETPEEPRHIGLIGRGNGIWDRGQ